MSLYAVRIQYQYSSVFVDLQEKYWSRIVDANSYQDAVDKAIMFFKTKYPGDAYKPLKFDVFEHAVELQPN